MEYKDIDIDSKSATNSHHKLDREKQYILSFFCVTGQREDWEENANHVLITEEANIYDTFLNISTTHT